MSSLVNHGLHLITTAADDDTNDVDQLLVDDDDPLPEPSPEEIAEAMLDQIPWLRDLLTRS